MAMTIINGTTATASVSVNSIAYDAVLGRWTGQASKSFFSNYTFTSGGWRTEIMGLRAVDIVSEGFLSHGVPLSDPLLDFGTAAGVACIFQADTTCTITGTFHIEKGFGANALAPSEFSIRARSTGAIASTWNTST